MTHSFPTRRSSDLALDLDVFDVAVVDLLVGHHLGHGLHGRLGHAHDRTGLDPDAAGGHVPEVAQLVEQRLEVVLAGDGVVPGRHRSEEHTSELQSLMRKSYAVFCLKKKKNN